MERDELDTQLPCDIRPGLNVAKVRLPRGIRRDSAGHSDAFQRGIILPGASKHPADYFNTRARKLGGSVAPNGGVITQWIECELHSSYADG